MTTKCCSNSNKQKQICKNENSISCCNAESSDDTAQCCSQKVINDDCNVYGSNASVNDCSSKLCCNDTNRRSEPLPCIDSSNGEESDLAGTKNLSCCNANKPQPCCNTKIVPLPIANIPNPITCLAVLRPNNTSIVVFDINGHPKSFRAPQLELSQLCFSSHNAGQDVDGMLTHCFDEFGRHGIPAEGCICGVEEPHLHAHLHSELCDETIECEMSKRKRTNWRFLSQITLHLVNDHGIDNRTEKSFNHMPINLSMPKECNSSAIQRHFEKHGFQLPSTRECCDTNKQCSTHRKYKIHHDDHTDYLVHNEETKVAFLEHPCNDCGMNDIHGKFHWIHTRSWSSESINVRDERQYRMHFFQEPHVEPFRLLDAFSHLFQLESSRVHAVRVVNDLITEKRPSIAAPSSATETLKTGRSQFFVEKICCASETKQIQQLLLKLDGVEEVLVNTTTKMTYVDHDPSTISAGDIVNILNQSKFGAHIKKDCQEEVTKLLSGIPTDVIVVSKFHIKYETRMAEKTDKAMTLDVIESFLWKKFPKQGYIASILIDNSSYTIVIDHNPYYLTAKSIADALDGYGYEVDIECDGGADGLWAMATMQSDVEDVIEHHKSTIRPTVILSGVFWIVSMLSLIGGKWDYLKYAALLSVVFGLPPIAVKACTTLRRCQFDVNCMMLFAVIGALALQEFSEAAAVTFLFAISEALESKCTSRARNALAAIICIRPEHANLINPITQDVVVLPAAAVAVGSMVRVKPGDKVPCDGVVMEGSSTIDESTLTGESRPVSKSKSMNVSGGTINSGSGQIVVKTTATSEDSAMSRLIRLVEEAQINRSDTEKMVDRFAKVYTPLVVVAAFCMATIPWAFGPEVGRFWLHNALITIVIACPCALVISTPVVYVAGLTASAQKGVIIKGGQHLESLGRVKAISFDKTGTLSQGVFQMLHFQEVGRNRKEVLSLLALLESLASHPLSDAIVKGAANEQVFIPTNIEAKNHTLLAGEGITATVEGKRVFVGNKKLFQRIDMYQSIPIGLVAEVDSWANEGATTGFIGIEGEGIIGAYCVADKIRDEAKSVVKILKDMGIEITMLTGDSHIAALSIGSQIGLDEVHIKSEMLPEDKLSEIRNAVSAQRMKEKRWKTKRSVMMVGDGVNDAPALALSDVSVAMGEGSSLAMETSDITLMDSNLEKLLNVICMGRRVIRTIFENIFISLLLKALVVGLLFSGYGSLWSAIASDVGAMLIVTLNGMKLLPYSQKIDVNTAAATVPKENEQF